MNGSPSVKVALNPRADGSMSPEYTDFCHGQKHCWDISGNLRKQRINRMATKAAT